MKVTLIFVPPGGGEADYSLDFDLPSVPQPGDYISIQRPTETGFEDFIVRRVWWYLTYPKSEGITTTTTLGKCEGITVEGEFALGHHSTESHKRACEMYKNRGKPIQTFQPSGY
jgi:hypothetical protein